MRGNWEQGRGGVEEGWMENGGRGSVLEQFI